ncbi:MAG: hypothetical protein ACLRZ9_02410 [Eubacterium sp.]
MMKKTEEKFRKRIIYEITWQGKITGKEYYDLENGLLDKLEIDSKEDWLNTVVQRIICDTPYTYEELAGKTYAEIWYKGFEMIYQGLIEVGCKIKTEPIYRKGAVYVKTVNGEEREFIMLNSPYDCLWSDKEKYVIAEYEKVEKYFANEATKEEIEETVRILDKPFEYEYLKCYDYLDIASYKYDLERGII